MNCGTVVAGNDGLTTITRGTRMTAPTGAMAGKNPEPGFVEGVGFDGFVRAGERGRVAGGRRVRHRLEGKIARGARPVLDDELPPEPLRQPLPHQARHDVLA